MASQLEDADLTNAPTETMARRIVRRTRGNTHGPITRLMSPGDLGELVKPFVFLDHFDLGPTSYTGTGLHPHSGIATVTYLFEGNVRYEDTTGETGTLHVGDVEWFKAAQGAWHGGSPGDAPRTRGFQLWLALGPEHELGAVESIYRNAREIEEDGPVRVLLGRHGTAASSLEAPAPITYLAVRLSAGEHWRYQPAEGQIITWAAVNEGHLGTPEPIETGEMVVFDRSNDAIDFHAVRDTEFVIGSAAQHGHDLVTGYYSVHTSSAALAAGERHILEVRDQLQSKGHLPAASSL